MAIRNIIAKGLGFAPGSIKWLPTHGFGSGEVPPEPPAPIVPSDTVPAPVVIPPPIASYTGNSISILIEDPLYYSSDRRRYGDRLTTQIDTYSHEIRAIGGYWQASFTIKDNIKKIEDWIEYGLGRHITVWSPYLTTVWEGFVSQIDATLGVFRYIQGPLLSIGNRVRIIYALEDSSVNPPHVGELQRTTVVNNTTSQARFGIVEKNYSLEKSTLTNATQAGTVLVTDPTRAYPPTDRRSNLSGNEEPKVTVTCLGYWHWLQAYYYANTAGVGTVNLSTKMQSVLAANPNTMFSTDYSKITTNTTPQDAYEDGDAKAEAILKELNGKGDTSFNSYTMGFYAGRQLRYEVNPTEIGYQQRISGNRGIVNKLDALVRPWDVTPAEYIFYPDFLVGRHPPTTAQTLGADPRTGFIERVVYTAPNSLEVNGVKLGTPDQVFAKYGLRGVA